MGNGGGDQAPVRHLRRVEAGGGMAARGEDKLWSERVKLYVDNGVEAAVRSRGVHNS